MGPKQFTLTLKYQVGELAEVTKILAHEGVNILGIFAREVEDHALVRIVVDDAVKTERLLRENNVEYVLTPGILVSMAHQPGALNRVTQRLAEEGIGIIYLYIVVLTGGQVAVAFKVDEMEDAVKVLQDAQLEVQEI